MCNELFPAGASTSLTFAQLPDELLLRILRHCKVAELLRINHRCRALALSLVRTVYPSGDLPYGVCATGEHDAPVRDPLNPHSDDSSLQLVLPALARATSLYTVKLGYLTSRRNIAMLAQLPQLKHVQLGHVLPMHFAAIEALATVQALTIASFQNNSPLDFVAKLSRLTSLTISRAHTVEVRTCAQPSNVESAVRRQRYVWAALQRSFRSEPAQRGSAFSQCQATPPWRRCECAC